jgi:hypothetical protein
MSGERTPFDFFRPPAPKVFFALLARKASRCAYNRMSVRESAFGRNRERFFGWTMV